MRLEERELFVPVVFPTELLRVFRRLQPKGSSLWGYCLEVFREKGRTGSLRVCRLRPYDDHAHGALPVLRGVGDPGA